jgi:hypothetical protein
MLKGKADVHWGELDGPEFRNNATDKGMLRTSVYSSVLLLAQIEPINCPWI